MPHGIYNPPSVGTRSRRLCRLAHASRRRITGAVTLVAFAATSLGVCILPVGAVDAIGPGGPAGCCAGQRTAAAIHVSGRTRCCCSQDSRKAGTCCCAGTKSPAPRKTHSSRQDKDQHGPVWSACNCGRPDSLWLVNSQPKVAARPVQVTARVPTARLAPMTPRSVPDRSLEPATPPPKPSCA